MSDRPEQTLALNEETLRLFPDVDRHQLEELAEVEGVGFLAMRLLEDGDASDLRSLFSQCGESRVREALVERGPRQLTRRSRALWQLLLGVEVGESQRVDSEDLWLL